MRVYNIPEIFFKKIAEKEKLYSRVWFFWLSNFVDELFEPEFIKKQEAEFPSVREIKEIYQFGVQLLRQDLKITEKDEGEYDIKAQEIIEYFNSCANTTYSLETGSNKSLIISRLKEGYSISEFKFVINKKINDWKSDAKMKKFIRPLTIFNKSKFENYLNENNDGKAASNNFTRLEDSIAKAKQIIELRNQ